MAMTESLNVVQVLKTSLEASVRRVITEELVKQELDKYEAKLREIIPPMVNQITFEKIESVRDHLALRDEIAIYIKWKDACLSEKYISKAR